MISSADTADCVMWPIWLSSCVVCKRRKETAWRKIDRFIIKLSLGQKYALHSKWTPNLWSVSIYGEPFLMPHFYLVEYISIWISRTQVCLGLCLALFLCPSHYQPSAKNTLTSENFYHQLHLTPWGSTLCCKLWHIQYRCDNETASQWSCHKSRAVAKWMCYCFKGNRSLWPSWKQFISLNTALSVAFFQVIKMQLPLAKYEFLIKFCEHSLWLALSLVFFALPMKHIFSFEHSMEQTQLSL